MTINEFNGLIEKQILVLDGATGTELQKRGMPKGVCPEKWVSENPEHIIAVQRAYRDAGANIVYSCTFGANRIKLEEFGLQDQVFELNKKLAQISREAMDGKGWVAGDMSPTGLFVEPFGELKFDDAVSIYSEQAKGLVAGGVDFFVVETMLDIQELRAAILGIKAVSDLPIFASMTFSADGRTLTGTDPISALITVQSLGAAAFGCNCSTGPDTMLGVIKSLKPYAKIPLLAKPNAGLPKLKDGKTVFDMPAEQFGEYVPDFIKAGVNLFGGCCGTAPDYIKEISRQTRGIKPVRPLIKSLSAVSSARSFVMLDLNGPLTIVGERINPTGKKLLQAELKEGKMELVRKYASEQELAGAKLLDVNMGMPGIDEKDMMIKSISLLSKISSLPLVIDSSNPAVIEEALKLYPGRALVNSISAEEHKLKKLLPICAKYGASFILLPLTDNEIPVTSDGRINVINKIFSEAEHFGFTREDIVVDGLVMTVSSDQNAAKETLKLFKWCSSEFKVNTICGLSNVSFGLPQRKNINASFLAMAQYCGLTMAIANPNEEILMTTKYSSDVLTAADTGSKLYINKFSDIKQDNTVQKTEKSTNQQIFDAVVEGNKDHIVDLIKKSLSESTKEQELVDKYLIPAINKVGDYYDKKIYFLPQLIGSAETLKSAFGYLEPLLLKSQGDTGRKKPLFVLATVKGDIHDIGKNIVALMLKNYGFEVIDLGKDVPAEKIVSESIRLKADIIGLSALMTTTMTEMKTVVDIAKTQGLKSKIIIGGAVITQDYSDEIGADGYGQDSIQAVKLAQRLLGIVG